MKSPLDWDGLTNCRRCYSTTVGSEETQAAYHLRLRRKCAYLELCKLNSLIIAVCNLKEH